MTTVLNVKRSHKVSREETQRRLVQMITDCQRQAEQDYFDEDRFVLCLQNDNDNGEESGVIGEGTAGEVLLLLLSRLEEEPKAGWDFSYYGRRDRDGVPVSFYTANVHDQRFYNICEAR